MPSDEILAMGIIDDTLNGIDDPDVVERVLAWALKKYGTNGNQTIRLDQATATTQDTSPPTEKPPVLSPKGNEIEGIAILEPEGKIVFTLRDIKADSKVDAGVKLTLLAAYVHENLTGNEECSRREVINPLLKEWRAYDGGVRGEIANHNGIISVNNRTIKLDRHAKLEAKKIVARVLDSKIMGTWSPNRISKPKKKAGETSSDKKTKKVSFPSLSIVAKLNLRPTNKVSLNDFVAQKKPTTHFEKCTLCAHYLHDTLSIEAISMDHIYTCYKHMQWRLPTDLSNMLAQAGTKGLLDVRNRSNIHVTNIGSNLIEHDLPKKSRDEK